ncbi:hypothetical protein B0H13DRAFT_1114539 [Mycena leptocephala]|nr:hypothetical protein B0H13DRAFT_1114539 [Mycena leptocephala]
MRWQKTWGFQPSSSRLWSADCHGMLASMMAFASSMKPKILILTAKRSPKSWGVRLFGCPVIGRFYLPTCKKMIRPIVIRIQMETLTQKMVLNLEMNMIQPAPSLGTIPQFRCRILIRYSVMQWITLQGKTAAPQPMKVPLEFSMNRMRMATSAVNLKKRN